jgi:hybrid cluster-associated redox disulfide protein
MKTVINEAMTVKELLDDQPHLLQRFIDLKLMCAGCPADAFHSLADVAKEYGLDQREFLADLQKAIGSAAGHHHNDRGSNTYTTKDRSNESSNPR